MIFYFSDIFEKRDPLQNGAIKFSLGEVCFLYGFRFLSWLLRQDLEV